MTASTYGFCNLLNLSPTPIMSYGQRICALVGVAVVALLVLLPVLVWERQKPSSPLLTQVQI